VTPLISGGGQEKGIRSGTLTPFLLSGLGQACELAISEFENDKKWVSSLSGNFFDQLLKNVGNVRLNGSADMRYKGNLNLTIDLVPNHRLIEECREVSMSSGAACLSDDKFDDCGQPDPSYVLTGIGLPKDQGL